MGHPIPPDPSQSPPLFPAMEHSIEEIVQKHWITRELQQKYDDLVRAGVRLAEENAEIVARLQEKIRLLAEAALNGKLKLWVIMAQHHAFPFISGVDGIYLTKEDAEDHIPAYQAAINNARVIPLKMQFSLHEFEVKL